MSTKRMTLPVELWQIDLVESWLIEQAQNGWILEKINGPSMTFQKTEPQNLEYRMIVMPEKKSTPTNTRELEQEGWHYVASYQYYYIFCSQQAGATTEIEKDLMKQAQSLSGVLLGLLKQFLFYVLLLVAFIGIALASYVNAEAPITSFIEMSNIAVMFFIFTSGSSMVMHFIDYLKVKRIKNQLERGLALDHHANWREAKVAKSRWKWLHYALAAILVFMLYQFLTKTGYEDLPRNTEDLPLLRLDMIESPERMEMSVVDVMATNSYEQNWTFLAPLQYEMNETRDVVEDYYSPRLKFRVIECAMPSLANALFTEWVTYYRFENDTKLTNTTFDQVLVEQIHEDTIRILTLKNQRVQYVDYQGEANIETILSALENL